MKMSAAYLAQTVAHLEKAGYQITETSDTKESNGAVAFHRTSYRCHKAQAAALVLELLLYPDGREAYYLEILQAGVLRSLSFPLDSWKFRPTLVEFKYYIHPNSGLGLSFILDLKPPD